MKTVITGALVLMLTLISCKKDSQNTVPTTADSLSGTDAVDNTSAPVDTDSMNTVPPNTGDSINAGRNNMDSAVSAPR